MPLAPFFINLSNYEAIVVGDTERVHDLALRLISLGAQVEIYGTKIEGMPRSLNTFSHPRWPEESDFRRGDFVFILTPSREISEIISRKARERGAFVWVEGRDDLSTFKWPYQANLGSLTLSINASLDDGKAMEEIVGQNIVMEWKAAIERFEELLAELKEMLIEHIDDKDLRMGIWNSLLKSDALNLIRSGNFEKAKSRCLKIIGTTTRRI